jgi:cobalt-zinc-cadmium efflux system outer membrane protein
VSTYVRNLARCCCALALSGAAVAALADDHTTRISESSPIIHFAAVPAEPVPLPPIDGSPVAKSLTLTEVEMLATAHYPAMREAEGHLQAVRGTWLQEGLRPNPTIGYASDDMGVNGTAGKQGGFISQEFVTAGKLGLSQAAASGEVAAAQQRLDRTRLQVITTARTYYYEVVAAQRAAELARQLQRMRSQAVEAADLRLKAAEGTRSALLQSQVELDTTTLMLEQTNDRREAAWRRLATLTGVDTAAPQQLEDKLKDALPELNWDAARERLLAESPELAELRAAVEGARWSVERAKAGRIPNVTVESTVQFDNEVNDTIAAVRVGVPLPVFDRNQGNIVRACGELAAAQAALDAKQSALEQRLATALRDYHTARRRVAKFTDSILPASRQSLDLVTEAYRQGETDYLQLLTVQQTYTESNLTYLEDLQAAWKQWAEIDGLLVGSLPESGN